MPLRDLSILMPARNEMFLQKTIDSILNNIEADTEIIAVLDGYWPLPPVKDHPRVILIHHTEPIGQRGGTNEAACVSRARYIMKMDAHCSVDKGFDAKLIIDIDDETTVVPRMYNLHAFDWVCACGNRLYQGPTPERCEQCGKEKSFERDIIWKPRTNRRTDFMKFDRDLIFGYWKAYERRPESKGEISDLMSSIGACWMMSRKRFWQLGGMDERHGSWGQMGTEVACKSWLSGGRQVVNKKTWFSHMFRTQGKDFGFPYPNPGSQVERARKHSRWLWTGGHWEGTKRPLSWLVDKFSPVPGWEG